jgi:hypothetical protein
MPQFYLHYLSKNTFDTNSVKWIHCHHGMARPRMADRGDGLQIWRVAANVLKKQSRTADSGWSSSLGIRRWAINPYHKTQTTLIHTGGINFLAIRTRKRKTQIDSGKTNLLLYSHVRI